MSKDKDNVISLADRHVKPQPIQGADKDRHLAGEVKCMACHTAWVASAPCGAVDLECPECGLMRGRMIYPVTYPPEGYERWMCGCGCDVFVVYRHPETRQYEHLCIGCGKSVNWDPPDPRGYG